MRRSRSTALLSRAERLLDDLRGRPALALLSLLLAVLAGAAAGLAAHAVGAAARVAWLGRWRGPARAAATRLTARRRGRALRRLAAAGTALPEPYLPERPTWIADRIRLADARVAAQYGLRLALIWPRLWQLLDTDTRCLVHDARDRFDRAGTLVGWAVLYAGAAVLWWPAAAAGAGLAGYAWWQGRRGAGLFADTVEATVDLHHRRLAETLGHPLGPDQPLGTATADAINDQLHKGATPYRQRAATGAVSDATSWDAVSVSRERQQRDRPAADVA